MFSDVAEEEDFSATLYGFTTQDDVKLAQALKDIGAAAKVVAGGDGAGWAPDASPELRAAVGKRMEFLEGLMAVLQSSGKVENVKKTPGLCKRAQKAGQELLASASLATADGIVGALDPIHPFINSKLLAPTPPREIESFTFVESVAFLDAEFGSLEAAADVSRCDSLEELDDFYDQFDRRDPGLLCRATLHQLAIGGEHVAGKVPMAELVSRSVADFDAITPAEWDAATLMGDEKVYVQLLQDFYTKGGALLHERYKLWGYNRARRRRKMAKFLPQVHTFYIQVCCPRPFLLMLILASLAYTSCVVDRGWLALITLLARWPTGIRHKRGAARGVGQAQPPFAPRLLHRHSVRDPCLRLGGHQVRPPSPRIAESTFRCVDVVVND